MKARFIVLVLGAVGVVAGAVAPFPWSAKVTPARERVLDGISEGDLRGNLSFLSSDLLEGRGTPSRGLDIAAEFIASQFRRAGLTPAGDDGYFQTTTYTPRAGGESAKVRNVIGVYPGTDPKLKDTYILVTAHYDHLGMLPSGPGNSVSGDRIYNGADDDGSGTVSVIEIANAMAAAGYRPKRSIVFMTFWGEEKGLLGSQFYGRNPRFPIAKTIANVNLEQVGRTDDTEGPRVNAVSITGEDYSDIGAIYESAGKTLGTGVQKHPQYSDMYFFASDNAALALQGIPAHTICTAFEYPDYHRVGDEWPKIDFANMVKVDRLSALGIMMLAESDAEPRWAAGNPKVARYLAAWRAHHPG